MSTEIKEVEDVSKLNEGQKKKRVYKQKLLDLFEEFQSFLICNVDNVGSNQLQQVRMALRGKAVILMGKNTVIRKVIREHEREDIRDLLPIIKGNIGFVFTNDNLKEVRDAVTLNQVPAAARTGLIAPSDVIIPSGSTGLDPGQTSFFQALNISTKIVRGSIELTNPVPLINKGEKVSASAVALLSKLGLKPFFFGIEVPLCCDNGSVFDASVLDLTDDALISKFARGVGHIAAISLATGFPSAPAVPHLLATAYKAVISISIESCETFDESKTFKDILSDPEALKKAQEAAAAASKPAAAAAAAAPEPEEESSSEDEGDAFDLFG